MTDGRAAVGWFPASLGETAGKRRAHILLVSILFVAVAGGVAAQAPSNDDCMSCHSDAATTRADGTPVAVDAEVFGASVHGGFACVDCHADLGELTEYPHPEELAPVDCATCHDTAAEYEQSVHAEPQGTTGAPGARCADCHGAHDIRPSIDPESRAYPLNVAGACGQCHAEAATHFADSIHGVALIRRGLIVAPTCNDCHDSHAVARLEDPRSRVHPSRVAATCGTCHAGIQRQYAMSVHAAALDAGAPAAPTCDDCHSAHDLQPSQIATWQLDVVDECGTCHIDRLGTYRDTYHGQVTALGFVRTAKCADCHNAHDVRPAEDPVSSVASANLPTTCGQCHANVTPGFLAYDPHADKNDPERSPALYYASRFMTGLLFAVFGFFTLHTAMWAARSLSHPDARRHAGARADADDHDGRAD